MQNKRFFVLFLSSLLLILLGANRTSAQQYIPREEEAPESLFQAEIGDSEVELFLLGSWNLSLTGSLGLRYSSVEKRAVPAVFPGMTPGFLFKQVPDITISLWLMNRYFFETSVREDSRENTYLFGYQGGEDEFLQSVRIGNTETDMDSYGYFTVPEPPKNSIGAYAMMESEHSDHEVLLRYEPAEEQETVYQGKYEITEAREALHEYIVGRYFILPDSAVSGVEVYVQDPEGQYTGSDGITYRPADAEEVSVSPADGTVSFSETQTGRVAVYYTKNGNPVGAASLGTSFLAGTAGGYIDTAAEPEDFNWGVTYLGIDFDAERQVTIGGKDTLLVHLPGSFSPFQACNAYELESDVLERARNVRGELLRKDDIYGTAQSLSVESLSEERTVAVLTEGVGRRAVQTRYPFADLYPENYGPDRETKDGYFGHTLEITILEESEGYYIDPNFIPGSVRVLINGREETRFTVDPATGGIEFLTMIFPDDRIEIKYKTAAQAQSGNINIGFGNRFDLLPGLTLEAGIGGLWNLLPTAYATEEEGKPGSLLLTAGIDYEQERLTVSADAGVAVSTPDTRGLFRIEGMEGAGHYFAMYESIMFPSSVPDGSLDPGGTINLSREGRGRLMYVNYRSYNFFTGTRLMPYTWTPPSDQTFPYESGSKTGPYAATTQSGNEETQVMALQFQIPEGSSWVGGQINLSKEPLGIDLTSARSISFYWRGESIPSTARIFLHVGSVSEDLDGDGVLDKESSVNSQGFTFNDPASGEVLLLGGGPEGTGNERLDSEDRNENGLLDGDIDSRIVKKEITAAAPVPGENWALIELSLTDSERKKLSAASAARIIMYVPGGGEHTGRLLIGGISVEASTFYGTASSPGTVESREVFEFQTGAEPSDYLSGLYPQVDSVFHGDDSSQKVLELTWEDVPVGGEWKLEKYVSPVPLENYREFGFYIKPASVTPAAGSTLSLSITGNDGNGLSCSFPLSAENEWQKVRVDLGEKKLYINEQEIPSAEVDYTPTAATAAKLTVEGMGTSGGTVYLDEFYLEKPAPSVSAGLTASAAYQYPETILSVRGVPVFGNFAVRGEASGTTPKFASGFLYAQERGALRSRGETSLELFFTRIHLEADLLYTGNGAAGGGAGSTGTAAGFYASGGHRIEIPAASPYISVREGYKENNTAAQNGFSRNNSISLSLPSVGSIVAGTEAYGVDTTLTQNWDILLAAGFSIPFSLNMLFSLEQTAENYTRERKGYFANWIGSYPLVLPWRGYQYPDRIWNGEISAALSTTPVGVTVSHTAGFNSYGTASRRQKNDLGFSISLPLTFFAGTPFAWSLTPGYSRELSYTGGADFSLYFTDDFVRFGTVYGSQDYLYGSIPFAELFSSAEGSFFSDSSQGGIDVRYTPAVSLGFTRSVGSHLYDLILPVEADITLKRNFLRDNQTVEDRSEWIFTLRNTARNLFGRLGVYPLLRFYETEEITTLFQLNLGTENVTVPDTTKLKVENIIYFEGKEGWNLTVNNRLDFTFDADPETTGVSGPLRESKDTVKLDFIWELPASFTLPLPFIKEEFQNALFFENSEMIETYFGPGFTEGTGGTAFGIVVTHTTKLVVPQTGYLSADMSFGFDRSSPYTWYLGIQAGIEVNLSF